MLVLQAEGDVLGPSPPLDEAVKVAPRPGMRGPMV